MGESKIKVINLCGEPLLKDVADWNDKKWDVWTYDSTSDLYFLVYLSASEVIRIETKRK